jgi:hypothetical protein
MMVKDYSTQFASQNPSGHKKNESKVKCFEVRYTQPQKDLPPGGGGPKCFVLTLLLGMQWESLKTTTLHLLELCALLQIILKWSTM